MGAEGLRFRVLRAQFATFRKDYGASVGICADIQGRVGFLGVWSPYRSVLRVEG